MGRSSKHTFLSEAYDVIDIFSAPIHLTLNKKRIITSFFGGILTIALVILIFYQTLIQFIPLVHHEDPSLYQIEDLEDPPSALPLRGSDHFVIAIIITVDSTIINMTNNAPFNFPTYLVKHRLQDDGSILEYNYPLLWAPCNQTDFPDDVYGEGTFSSINLQLGYCAYGVNYADTTTGECPEDILAKYPDCITPLEIDIQGDKGSENFDYIQANFKACDQSDSTLPYGVTCTSDNLTETLETGDYEVSLYTSNTAINMLNYEMPNQTFIEEIYWKIDPQIYKIVDIFVDKITVEDADHWALSTVNNRTFFQIDSGKVREIDRYLTVHSSKMLQLNWKRTSTNLVVARTYAKIQDILTDLGGFSKAAMFAAAFLAIGFVRYKYQLLVANGLYDFDVNVDSQDESKKKNDLSVTFNKNQSNSPLAGAHGASMLDSSPVSPSRSDHNLNSNKTIANYFKRLTKRGKLDESEKGYFKMVLNSLLCKKDPHIQMSAKARELATKDLDLIKNIKKLGEFDILKSIILNTNQRKIFEFFENPLLTLTDQQTVQKIKTLRASATSLVSSATLISKDLRLSLSKAVKTQPESDYANEQDDTPSALKKLKLKQEGKLRRTKTVTDDFGIIDYRRKSKRTESVIPRDHQEDHDVYSSLSKYGKLYMAYRHLKEDDNPFNKTINTKLISSLSPDLRKVFQRIDQILGDDYTVEHFEIVVQDICAEYSIN